MLALIIPQEKEPYFEQVPDYHRWGHRWGVLNKTVQKDTSDVMTYLFEPLEIVTYIWTGQFKRKNGTVFEIFEERA